MFPHLKTKKIGSSAWKNSIKRCNYVEELKWWISTHILKLSQSDSRIEFRFLLMKLETVESPRQWQKDCRDEEWLIDGAALSQRFPSGTLENKAGEKRLKRTAVETFKAERKFADTTSSANRIVPMSRSHRKPPVVNGLEEMIDVEATENDENSLKVAGGREKENTCIDSNVIRNPLQILGRRNPFRINVYNEINSRHYRNRNLQGHESSSFEIKISNSKFLKPFVFRRSWWLRTRIAQSICV